MLWRRADLERAGGIAALAKEVAEDAAATKIVRGAGLKVRLVDRPFAQPLGRRIADEVWNRQLRWARLRRASFLAYFLPEILSGGVLPMIAVAIIAADALGLPPLLSAATLCGAFWYGGEMLLAAAAGWPVIRAVSALRAGARPVCCRCCSSARCAAMTSSGAATKCKSSACGRAWRVAEDAATHSGDCAGKPTAAALAARAGVVSG